MDKETLLYFEDILMSDVQGLMQASRPPETVSDENLKRALNVQLEGIKADVSNIQHMLEA